MSDIEITVGYDDILMADKAAVGLEKRFKDLSSASKRGAASNESLYATFNKLDKAGLSLSQVYASIDKDQKMLASSAAKLENEVLKVSLANKSARDSARDMEAAFKAQEVTLKRNAAANRKLRFEFRDGYAAAVKLRAEQMRLSQAHRKGIIDADQLAAAQGRLGLAAQVGGRRMNSSGMLIQQAGYQFGDFAVQVQGGTNPMVAFGQQATQMIGAFNLLPAATLRASVGVGIFKVSVLGLIASLGVIVPVATAIGAYFMRVGEAAEKAKPKVKDFSETVEDARSAIDKSNDSVKSLAYDGLEVLSNKYGEVTREVRLLEVALANIDKKAKMVAVKSALDMLFKPAFFDQLQNNLGAVGAAIVATSDEDIAYMRKEIAALEQQVVNFPETAINLLPQLKEMKEELAAATLDLDNIGPLIDGLSVPAASLQTFKDLEASIKAATAEGNFTTAADSISKLRDLMKDLGVEVDEGVIAEITRLEEVLRQAESGTGALASGMDKVAARARNAANEVLGIFRALQSAMSSVEVLEAGAAAAKRAKESGLGEEAIKVTQAGAEKEKELSQLGVTGVELQTQVATAMAIERRKLTAQSTLESVFDSFNDSNKGGGGGGSKENAEAIEKLQKQLDLQEELIGKSEEYITVRNALGDSYSKIEPTQIANLQAQVVAIEAMKQAEADRKAIVDTVADSIGAGLTSIVDGTKSVKDAFKDMARAVIAELWKVFVVQKIVAGVKTLFGFADGGAFSGGSQVQAYADGGVVGSPTTFPMAGGKTGLMGEAGPEAIMPLKRGKDGKLGVSAEGGGSQNVTVVQNFNFQANGDESVKKIIAQAAPSISAMAQKGMMDQRRRGGAMKSTFG